MAASINQRSSTPLFAALKPAGKSDKTHKIDLIPVYTDHLPDDKAAARSAYKPPRRFFHVWVHRPERTKTV